MCVSVCVSEQWQELKNRINPIFLFKETKEPERMRLGDWMNEWMNGVSEWECFLNDRKSDQRE